MSQPIDANTLKAMLKPHLMKYQGYACSDGTQFAGNIRYLKEQDDGTIIALPKDERAPEELIDVVVQRNKDVEKDFQRAKGEGLANNIGKMGEYNGYSNGNIKQGGKLIDEARSGCCTSFALAGAKTVLDLKSEPEFADAIQRVETVAYHPGKEYIRGSHCYVIVNRKDPSDINDPSTWGPDALIVDPWLASLQNPPVYTVPEFQKSGFLSIVGDAQVIQNFDTRNPHLVEQKRKEREITAQKREGDIDKLIERGNLDLLKQKIEKCEIDPNTVIRGQTTLLMHAVEKDQTEIAKYLIEKGANVNAYREVSAKKLDKQFKISIMHIALNKGNPDILISLLEKTTPANTPKEDLVDIILKLPELQSLGVTLTPLLVAIDKPGLIEAAIQKANEQLKMYTEIEEAVKNLEHLSFRDRKEQIPKAINEIAGDNAQFLDEAQMSLIISKGSSEIEKMRYSVQEAHNTLFRYYSQKKNLLEKEDTGYHILPSAINSFFSSFMHSSSNQQNKSNTPELNYELISTHYTRQFDDIRYNVMMGGEFLMGIRDDPNSRSIENYTAEEIKETLDAAKGQLEMLQDQIIALTKEREKYLSDIDAAPSKTSAMDATFAEARAMLQTEIKDYEKAIKNAEQDYGLKM